MSLLTCTTRRPVWLFHNIKAARLAIARIDCRRGREAGVQLWAPGQRSEEDRQALIGPCLTVAAEILQVPEADLRPALPGSRAPPQLLAMACTISRAPQWGWELGHPLLHSHLPPEPPPFYLDRNGARLSSTTAPVAVHADKTACRRHQCTYAALRKARTALYREVNRIEADLGLPDLATRSSWQSKPRIAGSSRMASASTRTRASSAQSRGAGTASSLIRLSASQGKAGTQPVAIASEPRHRPRLRRRTIL